MNAKPAQKLWLEHMLFSWQWWLLLALTVLPWIFGVAYHKKESTCRLLFAGVFSALIAQLLNAVGSTFGLWVYTTRLLPLFLKLYRAEHWSHFCSFPIYAAFYLAADWLTGRNRFDKI